MDIVEFFELSSGKWFSQRTSHHLASRQSEWGKSDVYIEALSNTDPAVLQLCEQSEIDAASALCGLRIRWDGILEEEQNKQSGSTLLVAIGDSEKSNEGKLLRQGEAGKAPVVGRYSFGSDDAVTLITESETLYSEERIWFASPNLRLRTTLVKQPNGFSMGSFYSEIRMGGAKPQPAATDKAQATS